MSRAQERRTPRVSKEEVIPASGWRTIRSELTAGSCPRQTLPTKRDDAGSSWNDLSGKPHQKVNRSKPEPTNELRPSKQSSTVAVGHSGDRSRHLAQRRARNRGRDAGSAFATENRARSQCSWERGRRAPSRGWAAYRAALHLRKHGPREENKRRQGRRPPDR